MTCKQFFNLTTRGREVYLFIRPFVASDFSLPFFFSLVFLSCCVSLTMNSQQDDLNSRSGLYLLWGHPLMKFESKPAKKSGNEKSEAIKGWMKRCILWALVAKLKNIQHVITLTIIRYLFSVLQFLVNSCFINELKNQFFLKEQF